MTLNFLKKSMPRMGPATGGLQNTCCQKLALKLHSFIMKPQEGIGCPSAPLRRGPDGLEF